MRTKARARLGALLGARLDELMPSFARLLGIKTESDAPVDVEAAYGEWIFALARLRPVPSRRGRRRTGPTQRRENSRNASSP